MTPVPGKKRSRKGDPHEGSSGREATEKKPIRSAFKAGAYLGKHVFTGTEQQIHR
jgi:hypothetical protein